MADVAHTPISSAGALPAELCWLAGFPFKSDWHDWVVYHLRAFVHSSVRAAFDGNKRA
jgi:hypothetical protein